MKIPSGGGDPIQGQQSAAPKRPRPKFTSMSFQDPESEVVRIYDGTP
jgi:hypothetical protein